jgi:hypothetical protein
MSASIAASNDDKNKDGETSKTVAVGSAQTSSSSTTTTTSNTIDDDTPTINDDVQEDETASSQSPPVPLFLSGIIPQKYLEGEYRKSFIFYSKAAGVLLGTVFVCNPLLVSTTLWNLVTTIIGIALGIGLGVGLALHVFQQLQKLQIDFDKNRLQRRKLEAQSRQLKHLEESIATSGRLSRQKASLLTRGLLSGTATGGGTPIAPDNANNSNSNSHLRHHSSLFSSASSIGDAVAVGAEDGDSYVGLMAQAGYLVHDGVLRGQVLREEDDFWKVLYRFTDDRIDCQRGVRLVADDWPALPKAVTGGIGRFIEHVMRDFVSSWYSTLDRGVIFRMEQEKRDKGIPRDGGGDNKDEGDDNNNRYNAHNNKGTTTGGPEDLIQRRSRVLIEGDNNMKQENHSRRKMVFSTLTHRRAPMLDCCYKMMSSCFGNLATRAEHVNILELVLLKWSQVLGQTLNEYRTLRKSAQDKNMQQSHPRNSGNSTSNTNTASAILHKPSEVEVTREFLLAGKLHRAITFGLDIPSLLFADASGEECGLGINSDDNNNGNSPNIGATRGDPTKVLEYRLYHTNILQECQIDYNRILANRLVRALMPKSETTSQCVLGMVTEIIGGSVLTPIMNLWVPSFLNDLIVKLLTVSNARSAEISRSTSTAPRKSVDAKNVDAETIKGDKISNQSAEPVGNFTYTLEESDRQIQSDGSAQMKMSKSGNNSFNDKRMGGTTLQNSIDDQIHKDSAFPANKEPSNYVDSKTKEDNCYNETMGYKLLKLSELAMQDLNKQINFERYRSANRGDEEETGVNWDDAECQNSILKLVMVIEAALLHGRCAYNEKKEEIFPDLLAEDNHLTETNTEIVLDANSLSSEEDTNVSKEKKSIAELLMELATDMDAFEKQIDDFMPEEEDSSSISSHGRTSQNFEPDVNEVATLRTLICTWLHTGQLFKAIDLICKGADTIFAAFYASDAFLLMQDERKEFTRQMKVLDELEIMVETMAVRVSKRLVVPDEFDLLDSAAEKEKTESHASSNVEAAPKINDSSRYYGHQSTPRYLDFQRNEAFAASLRAERKRRWRVWETRKMDKDVHTMIRKTASAREYELHSEMHKLSRLFYNGTTIMTIRDAARKKERAEVSSNEKVSLLTVEIVSNRRRIEVPDDDSSFLLRAQSRQLNPVSVHLDDRNHDMSYKCFLATYMQPAISQGSARYVDGRYIRRCFLQYYPSDRTARIVLQNDARKLDKRKGIGPGNVPANGHANENQTNSFFSRAFLNQRYLCQKVSATQSFMSSSLMESTDFNAFPRTGKALNFIYRMPLFESPVVDLAGEQFTIQDSTNRGVYRANASSFEVSDASLSYVLLKCGKDYGTTKHKEQRDGKTRGGFRKVETGRDGYPVLFLRFTKSGDQVGTEFKPYRLSFVRAALMLTSTRQEAQLDSLIECVKAGSAKSATKARTEEQLRPVRKMLYFANGSSEHNFNQDLKLGQFLDRGQLQRNGLLNLRHPTSILHLEAKVEGTALAKEVPLASLTSKSYNADTILYKIRCTVVVELVNNGGSADDFEPYALDDGSHSRFYREEFIVHRSMKEFQNLHKQLKSQVALTESTMSTGNRIVGVATAALSSHSLNRRNKKILIPSLAQAGKIGAMGMTKRSIIKRMELLDEYIGYLLASNSLMNRSSELLLFLGASHPFPPEVTMTKAQGNIMDLLGRTNFIRSVALNDVLGSKLKIKTPIEVAPRKRTISTSNRSLADTTKENGGEPVEAIEMDPHILNKVDQIPLAEVRNRILELIRLSFSFENASFVRSQMLSALETASFLAVAKQSDFRRILHDLHAKHISGEAIGGWIEKILDILWPDGVWMKPSPLLSPEEEHILRVKAKAKLHEGFPDQFRTLFGKEMTEEGLNMIHEMLQNKVIVKSLFYMLLDLLWIEVFPELRDTLPCASALDLDLL